VEARRLAPDALATPLLEADGLSKSFRGLQALVDYELRLPPLTIHGVIGPNGAGKTTLFHLLSGFLRPSSGTIAFEGHDITGSAAYAVSRMGIGRTFQNIRLFGELSVLDNVKVALQRRAERSFIETLLSSASFRAAERDLETRAMELLELFGLAAQRDAKVASDTGLLLAVIITTASVQDRDGTVFEHVYPTPRAERLIIHAVLGRLG